MINRTDFPPITASEAIHIPEPQKTILRNGLPLYIVNAGEADVSKIEILFHAGAKRHKNFLLADAANALLEEGTKNKSSHEIAELFEFYGVQWSAESTADWAAAGIATLNKFLPEVLPLCLEILTEAVYPNVEINTYITQSKQRLQVNNDKVSYVARKEFNRQLFGHQSAYGFYQKEGDYDFVNHSDLLEFHQKNYLNGAYAIIVSGKINDRVIQQVENSFSEKINPGSFHKSDVPELVSSIKYFEKKDALQAAIRIGKRMVSRLHPDFKPLVILNTVLGGYFGSRLMSNIREDKGYTYGIGSALVSLQDIGYFYITAEVGKNVCASAVKEIYSEIERLQNELVPDDELQLVKNYLLGSFQRNIDGPFALADRLKTVLMHQSGLVYYREYLEILDSISSIDLLNLAQKYFSKESFSEVVVG